MSKQKLLGENQIRQTDSGPDNEAVITHAFHWLLVHVGAVNKLIWNRGAPKHSHNKADRVNSMMKEIIWPRSGADAGGVQTHQLLHLPVRGSTCAGLFVCPGMPDRDCPRPLDQARPSTGSAWAWNARWSRGFAMGAGCPAKKRK